MKDHRSDRYEGLHVLRRERHGLEPSRRLGTVAELMNLWLDVVSHW